MKLLRALPLLLVALSAAHCYVEAEPVVAVEPEVEYEPLYYGDNVIYFDEAGLPFYRVGGEAVFIERTDPQFDIYVNHYATHREAYRRWEGQAHEARVEKREHVERERKKRRRR